jgi:hypothetical protein
MRVELLYELPFGFSQRIKFISKNKALAELLINAKSREL